jgi:hypothetical protein
MSKLIVEGQTPMGQAANVNPYPTIDRFTLATLPKQGTINKAVLVTDGTFAPSTGLGSVYVGGGSLLNLIWWNGQAWITC